MMMHPKPALRHTNFVEPFSTEIGWALNVSDEDKIGVKFMRHSDGATQLLVVSKEEARALANSLMDHVND